MKSKQTVHLLLVLLVLGVITCLSFFAGYLFRPRENTLRLNVTVAEGTGYSHFSKEELAGNYDGISYHDLSAVTIDVNGKTMMLEEAIRNNSVTVEQIIAQAQEDARNRECFLKYDNTLGLSTFRYVYPDQYDLRIINDIFECSDGKLHHIKDFMITAPGQSSHLFILLRSIDINSDGERVNLLYEDWGLKFTVTELSPTGISLEYIQQGGMAVGDLSVKWFHVYNDQGMINEQLELPMEPIYIQKNAEGEFTLNWEPMLGALPSGEYTLVLYVYDNFDESEIHPLIQKYCYGQYYSIPFTIS